MSLKSFLNKIGHFFSNLFKSLTKVAKKAVEVGVDVTNAIKQFDTEHPEAANLLTALIPGTLDDKIRDRVRAALPDIMVRLRLADATLDGKADEVLIAGIKAIQSLTGSERNTFLNSLSVLIAEVAADGEVDLDDLLYLQQWFYKNQKEDEVDTTVDEEENQ